jgi:hypothetical protein
MEDHLFADSECNVLVKLQVQYSNRVLVLEYVLEYEYLYSSRSESKISYVSLVK